MDSNSTWQVTLDATSSSPKLGKYTLTRQVDARLHPISAVEASAIASVVRKLSGYDGAAILWFPIDGRSERSVEVDGSRIVPDAPDQRGSRWPVMIKWCSGADQMAETFHRVWNEFGGVQIYPLSTESEIDSVAIPHFNNRDDQAGFGFGQDMAEPPKIETFDDGFRFALAASRKFIARFAEPEFIARLSDPFEPRKDIALVQQTRVFLWKGGHDEEVCLELLAARTDLVPLILETTKEFGIAAFSIDRAARGP